MTELQTQKKMYFEIKVECEEYEEEIEEYTLEIIQLKRKLEAAENSNLET